MLLYLIKGGYHGLTAINGRDGRDPPNDGRDPPNDGRDPPNDGPDPLNDRSMDHVKACYDL